MIPIEEVTGTFNLPLDGQWYYMYIPVGGLASPDFRLQRSVAVPLFDDIEEFFEAIIQAAAPLENPSLSWEYGDDGDGSYCNISVTGGVKPTPEQIQAIHTFVSNQMETALQNRHASVRNNLMFSSKHDPNMVLEVLKDKEVAKNFAEKFNREEMEEAFNDMLNAIFAEE